MEQTQIADRIEMQRVDALIPYAKNARTHSAAQIAQIAASIKAFGFTQPVLIDGDGVIVAGHGRVMAAREVGLVEVPTIRVDWLTDAQRRAYILADNKIALLSGWDEALLTEELRDLQTLRFDMSAIGFNEDELASLIGTPAPPPDGSTSEKSREDPGSAGEAAGGAANASLAERFMIPPFSVLSAREGWWQRRKAAWLSLGIRSEVGRVVSLGAPREPVAADHADGAQGLGTGKAKKRARADKQSASLRGALTVQTTTDPYRPGKGKRRAVSVPAGQLAQDEVDAGSDAGYEAGTSIFDPVLCEIVYRWFCPPTGTVLDPFAGGSVRGIVAARLGRRYVGHELRTEQVEANRAQAAALCADSAAPPSWIEGDSREIDQTCVDVQADMIFSCPPYADLEVYSDDPRDLSTMPYAQFRDAYREVIRKSCAQLKPDRFACFVVGEVRGADGNYYGFVNDTIDAFRDAGLAFYNEAILVTHLGSLPLRVGKQFSGSRKVGKTHQNVLVFLKGDAKHAVAACGSVEVPVPDADQAAAPGASIVDDLSKYGEVMQ